MHAQFLGYFFFIEISNVLFKKKIIVISLKHLNILQLMLLFVRNLCYLVSSKSSYVPYNKISFLFYIMIMLCIKYICYCNA